MKPAVACLLAALLGCSTAPRTEGDDVGADADTDADADIDTDADADADADSDTGTGGDTDTWPEMTACDGGWLDPATDLCWQDPPSDDLLNWYRAAGMIHETHNPEGANYCGTLIWGGHSDWRLPDIEELISVLRGCVNGNETGDASPSACAMNPPGCVETDDCTSDTQCLECSDLGGPGEGGCYWDPSLEGPCGRYWSSSVRQPTFETPIGAIWSIDAETGSLCELGEPLEYRVRCVR